MNREGAPGSPGAVTRRGFLKSAAAAAGGAALAAGSPAALRGEEGGRGGEASRRLVRRVGRHREGRGEAACRELREGRRQAGAEVARRLDEEARRAGQPDGAGVRREVAREAEPLEAPLRSFLERHRGAFDAIVGFDAMASLAIRLIHRLGLRVPADVAVVGAGNSLLATYGVLPLTSVSTADDTAGSRAKLAEQHQPPVGQDRQNGSSAGMPDQFEVGGTSA